MTFIATAETPLAGTPPRPRTWMWMISLGPTRPEPRNKPSIVLNIGWPLRVSSNRAGVRAVKSTLTISGGPIIVAVQPIRLPLESWTPTRCDPGSILEGKATSM